MSERLFTPGAIGAAISSAKNDLKGPADMAAAPRNQLDRIAALVWQRYDALLRENNAVDFDDLMVLVCRLFETSDAALEKWQERYQHILVDEYQDTNRAQYVLLRYLAGFRQNLAVVGDDDQSVFSWRGADVRNILDFERDYPNAKVVKREQNYRSTQKILDAAWSVVRNNADRKEKKLWTKREGGPAVVVIEAYDERHEAEAIAREIERLQRQGEVKNNRDVACCTGPTPSRRSRTCSPVRSLRISRRRRPSISGGVKETLAYLRIVRKPLDKRRAPRVTTRPRGVGEDAGEALHSARQRAHARKRFCAPRSDDSERKEALTAFGRLPRARDEATKRAADALPRESRRRLRDGLRRDRGGESGTRTSSNAQLAEEFRISRGRAAHSSSAGSLVSDQDELANQTRRDPHHVHAVKGLSPIVSDVMETRVRTRSLDEEKLSRGAPPRGLGNRARIGVPTSRAGMALLGPTRTRRRVPARAAVEGSSTAVASKRSATVADLDGNATASATRRQGRATSRPCGMPSA